METFTPSLDWGNELLTSALWVAKAWAIAAVGTVVVLCPARPVHDMGPAVLAHHRRLLQGPRKHPGVGTPGRAAAVGDDRRAPRRAVQLSVQRPVLGAPGRVRRRRGRERRCESTAFGSRLGSSFALIIADIVRTLLDTYLMQRFIIRWRVWLTHRLTGDWLDGDAYYRGTVRRRSDRQSGPAHPAGHRHLHHRHRPGNQHADRRNGPNAAIRHGFRHRVDGRVHSDLCGVLQAR